MRLDLRQILKIYPAYQGLTVYPHCCCIFVRRLESLGNRGLLWVTDGRCCANSGCMQKQYLNHPLVPIYHLPRFASPPFLRTGKIGWTPNWWILMQSPQWIHKRVCRISQRTAIDRKGIHQYSDVSNMVPLWKNRYTWPFALSLLASGVFRGQTWLGK